MNYTTLILKKIYKNKLNIIPFVLITIGIFVMYTAENANTWSYLEDPYFSGAESIERLQEEISSYQKVIVDESEPSEMRKQATEMIAPAKQEMTYLQDRLAAAKHKDWISYYTNDIELQKLQYERTLNDVSQYGWNQEEMTRPIDRTIAYDQHMIDYDLGYDGNSPLSIISIVSLCQ